MLTRIAVVVPAHDEQDLLPACLYGLHRSAREIPGISVEIVVVADACTDRTPEIARAGGAHLVTIDARNVGRARSAGMQYALRRGTTGLWLATTDADTLVGPGWLRWHRAHADAGTQVLAGTVAVTDWEPWSPAVRDAYDARYQAEMTAIGHRHMHGANLGCDADAYATLGGFHALPHDEDRDLVARAHVAGCTVVYDRDEPVLTSARRTARAPSGFAAYIATLAE